MQETTEKKNKGACLVSWIILLGAAAALIITVKTCCPAFFDKAVTTLGLDENGKTAQAFSVLTERLGQGEIKEAFSESYELIRGNED